MRLTTGCIRRFMSDEGSGGSGQALAEFAISFPLQLGITFGVLQTIFLLVSALMVNYAAFSACRSELVGEDGLESAAVVLSPLVFHNKNDTGNDNFVLPGWGELRGSGRAKDLMEYETSTDSGVVEVRIVFKQELLFPFVDRLFYFFGGDRTSGRGFAGSTESNGRAEIIDGRVHVVVSRSHRMRQDSNIDVSESSGAYDYQWE